MNRYALISALIVGALHSAEAPKPAAAAAPAPSVASSFAPSDELNAQLPKWLRFSGEFRGRLEGFAGGAFKRDNDDLYYLNRFRVNMRIQPAAWMKFYFQGQDARVFGKNQNPAAPPFQDTMDLRLAYVELGDVEKGHFALRGGRQELVFGEQRLIGHGNWLNTARSFDAIRATLRGNAGKALLRLDAFASSVVNARDGELNHHQQGNNFHGLYGGIEKLVPNATIESYLLWRVAPWFASPVLERGGRGKLDFKTAGFRWAGKLPANFDYGVEIAKQYGSLSADDVSAWAGHWRTGYTMAKVKYTPRLVAEYNFASGDSDPKDGTRGTFDPLYPTPHDKYGLTDQVGWRNIHDLRLGTELKPTKKVLVSAFYHDWWLANEKDALYAASGAAVARSVAGTAGRHVGREADLQANYTVNKQVQVGGGLGHIFPGEFLKKTTPGKAYTFPYLMLGYAF